ncbi:MAG: hypothetical protein K0B08_02790 [Bacteroidales bacterium]|nr:hypothetical protein [Bacteroidales bacterium]
MFHQVSDKRLARVRRAVTTLSPQGGGSARARPGNLVAARHRQNGGVWIDQRRKVGKEKDRWPQSWGSEKLNQSKDRHANLNLDPEKKEPKGTGFKGQSQ